MCSTSVWFRSNCSGGGARECPFGCGYAYCDYHLFPNGTVATLIGGHVCSKVTAGTGIIGDNIFDMAANCVMLATTGAARPAALLLDAALDEVISRTPGGPELNKLNNLQKKLKDARQQDARRAAAQEAERAAPEASGRHQRLPRRHSQLHQRRQRGSAVSGPVSGSPPIT